MNLRWHNPVIFTLASVLLTVHAFELVFGFNAQNHRPQPANIPIPPFLGGNLKKYSGVCNWESPVLSWLITPNTRLRVRLSMQEDFGSDDIKRLREELNSIQESQRQNAILDALFVESSISLDVRNDGDKEGSSSSSLISIYLSGQARLPVVRNQTKAENPSTSKRIALVLSQDESVSFSEEPSSVACSRASLLLPLSSRAQLKLISFAAARRPLSKSVLLGLNTLLVNRDNALFDNLPWSVWSVDPKRRNRDAAGNPIAEKFHLGKRDAYNRFLGKDWQGRSLAIGNLALRIKYLLEEIDHSDETGTENSKERTQLDKEESRKALAIRLLQLQIRELQMELADVESRLAIQRSKGTLEQQIDEERNFIQLLGEEKSRLEGEIASAQEDISAVASDTEKKHPLLFGEKVSDILEQIAQWTTDNGKNAAPYRGAMGYAPILDSKKDIEESLLPYTSPYDLLNEILEEQLNARVIGCVLENTSLLRGNLALGGAVVLQRIIPTKTTKLMGEQVEYIDYDEDFGNIGIKGGETMIVECDSDEAIGMALACQVPLKIESAILQRATVMTQSPVQSIEKSSNIIEFLSMWTIVDQDLSLQVEGESEIQETQTKSFPISIPRTTESLFDSLFEEKPTGSSLFPTDNPIQSLAEFDRLRDEDKAKTLLELSNFSGKLPRPRVVRASKTNPLDELLLPLIDESVRRQFLIRDAKNRGDMERVAELEAGKSSVQMAKEKARQAREAGLDNSAEQWETEAEFLASLRADVTQDEGAYDRFLDQDYWYEKDRQATAKRVDRSKFGNLLDGIE